MHSKALHLKQESRLLIFLSQVRIPTSYLSRIRLGYVEVQRSSDNFRHAQQVFWYEMSADKILDAVNWITD